MKTFLYEQHEKLGAKIGSFAEFMMPISYQGILKEHHFVQTHAGIFDICHMGRIDITGPEAAPFLEYLSTNHVDKDPMQCVYTVLCNETGGSCDDTIIYKFTKNHFFLVANASNREKVLVHLKKWAESFDVKIFERFDEGILAIQGPMARKIISRFLPDCKPMRMQKADDLLVTGTGYTGLGGVEVFGPPKALEKVWQLCLDAGICPTGLGARDLLRLEAGFALYGHELDDDISPTESIAAWTVKQQKDFLGKEALKKRRSQHGVTLLEKGIPRQGCRVFVDDAEVGHVTSGTFSPTLNQGIAIIMTNCPLAENQRLKILIRDNLLNARVTQLPFYRRSQS